MKKLLTALLMLSLIVASACAALPIEELSQETAAETENEETENGETETAESETEDVTTEADTEAVSDTEPTEETTAPTLPEDGVSEPTVDTDKFGIPVGTALAEPSEKLKSTENFKKLHAILSKDTFPLSVKAINITEEAVTADNAVIGNIVMPFGSDALTVSVDFGGTKEVSDFVLSVVGIDPDGNLTRIHEQTAIDVIKNPMNTDPSQSFECKSDKGVDGMNVYLWCVAEKFEHIFAFVSEYTLSDGTVVKNPVKVDFENTVSHRAYDLAPFDGVFTDNEAYVELTELEAESDFGLKVTARFGYRDMNTSSLLNPDALRIAVVNSTDAKITDYSIYAVGINSDGNFVSINWKFSLSKNGVVNVFKVGGADIEAGATDTADLECFLGDFVSARAIVASYITEDGTVYENPITVKWVNTASGK